MLSRIVEDDALKLMRVPVPGCESCERWSQRLQWQVNGLQTLGRAQVPDELRERLAAAPHEDGAEVEHDTGPRFAAALSELPRLPVPELLADRVEREFAPSSVRALADLAAARAPSVLERLVTEELADPAGQRSRRFVGDLVPRGAPATLWRRVFDTQSTTARRAWRPVAALAAAALIVWTFTRTEPVEESWSFAVVRVEDPRALDPMARALAGGLTGGAASALSLSGGGATGVGASR